MWRMILSMSLLGIIGMAEVSAIDVGPISQGQPPDAFSLYFPIVQKPPVIEVVEITRGELIGYPTIYYLYGYVNNLTSGALYSVTIDLEITRHPYEMPPYTETVHLRPGLTATLPGQINPFSFFESWGKAWLEIGPIRGVSVSRWEGEALDYPLTITSWKYEGTVVSGTARNDSGYPLNMITIVVANLRKCNWYRAVPDLQSLLPGESTIFQFDYYTPYCLDENLTIVGQGRVFSPK